MSGKLFLQIVILIIIAAIVLSAVKIGVKCLYKSGKLACPLIASQQK